MMLTYRCLVGFLCFTSDLALRCLLETPGLRNETEPAPKRPKTSEPVDPEALPAPGPLLGLAVALCCHHRCEWRHYVGQEYFRQRGLGAAEFSVFCRMSSWATCGLRPTKQEHADQDVNSQTGNGEECEALKETRSVSW